MKEKQSCVKDKIKSDILDGNENKNLDETFKIKNKKLKSICKLMKKRKRMRKSKLKKGILNFDKQKTKNKIDEQKTKNSVGRPRKYIKRGRKKAKDKDEYTFTGIGKLERELMKNINTETARPTRLSAPKKLNENSDYSSEDEMNDLIPAWNCRRPENRSATVISKLLDSEDVPEENYQVYIDSAEGNQNISSENNLKLKSTRTEDDKFLPKAIKQYVDSDDDGIPNKETGNNIYSSTESTNITPEEILPNFSVGFLEDDLLISREIKMEVEDEDFNVESTNEEYSLQF